MASRGPRREGGPDLAVLHGAPGSEPAQTTAPSETALAGGRAAAVRGARGALSWWRLNYKGLDADNDAGPTRAAGGGETRGSCTGASGSHARPGPTPGGTYRAVVERARPDTGRHAAPVIRPAPSLVRAAGRLRAARIRCRRLAVAGQ